MADEWYYVRDGQRVGPISARELKRMADVGEIAPADMVSKKGLGKWVPASSVNGLWVTTKNTATESQADKQVVFSECGVTITSEFLVIGPHEFDLRQVTFAFVLPELCREDMRIHARALLVFGCMAFLLCVAALVVLTRARDAVPSWVVELLQFAMFPLGMTSLMWIPGGIFGILRKLPDYRLCIRHRNAWNAKDVLLSDSYEELVKLAETINRHLPNPSRVCVEMQRNGGIRKSLVRFFRRVMPSWLQR